MYTVVQCRSFSLRYEILALDLQRRTHEIIRPDADKQKCVSGMCLSWFDMLTTTLSHVEWVGVQFRLDFRRRTDAPKDAFVRSHVADPNGSVQE
jgi:hypothetical protein